MNVLEKILEEIEEMRDIIKSTVAVKKTEVDKGVKLRLKKVTKWKTDVYVAER